MRSLNTNEIDVIAGGNFNIHVVARVPDTIKDWVTTMIANIENAVIKEPYTFVLYLNQATYLGVNFGAIKIQEITYQNINT